MLTKFSASFEFDSDAVVSFARYLGYQDSYPATPEQFVSDKFKVHADSFNTSYAQFLVEQELAKQRPVLVEQIVTPIQKAMTVTYEKVVEPKDVPQG